MRQKPFIPEWLFQQNFNPHQLSVYSYVLMRGSCFEDKRNISKALHMSKNTFFKTQKQLLEGGWIEAETDGKKTCLKATCLKTGTRMSPKSGTRNENKCIKSGTRSGKNRPETIKKQTTCPKSGTVTNSTTIEEKISDSGRHAAFVASYLVGQSLRGGRNED